ncbi:MAG: gliding motility-associated C-terminal domain-containing protein [Bacteroidetes bacterium]|nr:gliding motility-associated C-terminal domain-containing protein [Bacteroidota bacterium]
MKLGVMGVFLVIAIGYTSGYAQTSKVYSLDLSTVALNEESTPQSGQYAPTDYSTVTKALVAEPFADNYAVGVPAGSIHFGASGVDSVFYGGDLPTQTGFGASAVPIYTKETFDKTNLPIQLTCMFYSDQDIPAYNEAYLFFIPADYKHFGSPTYYVNNQASQKEGINIGGRPYQSWVQDTRSATDPSRVLVDVTHNIAQNGEWYELSCVIDMFNGDTYVRNVTIDGKPTFTSAISLGTLPYMDSFRVGFAADDLAYGFKITSNYRDVIADFNMADTICVGTCIDFENKTIIENAAIPTLYNWTFEGAEITQSTTKSPTDICYKVPGKYRVTLVSSNQFVQDTTTKWLYVKSFETLDLGKDRPLCDGDSLVLSLDIANVAFTWSNGSSDSFLTINKPGVYAVKIERGGCSATDSIEIFRGNNLNLDLGSDTLICDGSTFSLDASVTGGISYLWNNSDKNARIPVNESGTYVVEVVGGCETIRDSIHVQVEGCDGIKIWLPNAFSPNSDNLNEIFKPIITSNVCCQIKSYRFRIYNLWGELLFETDEMTDGWNGKILDTNVQQDIYIWMIEFKDVYMSKQYKGEGHVFR